MFKAASVGKQPSNVAVLASGGKDRYCESVLSVGVAAIQALTRPALTSKHLPDLLYSPCKTTLFEFI